MEIYTFSKKFQTKMPPARQDLAQLLQSVRFDLTLPGAFLPETNCQDKISTTVNLARYGLNSCGSLKNKLFANLGQDQQLHLTVYIAGIQGGGSVVVAFSVGDM